MSKKLALILIIGAVTLGVFYHSGEDTQYLSGIETLQDTQNVETKTLQTELETLKSPNGDYVQIKKDGTVAGGGTIDKSVIPPNTWTETYDGPTGKGYVIFTEYPDRIEKTGYGPQSSTYTETILKETAKVATST